MVNALSADRVRPDPIVIGIIGAIAVAQALLQYVGGSNEPIDLLSLFLQS